MNWFREESCFATIEIDGVDFEKFPHASISFWKTVGFWHPYKLVPAS